MGQLNPEIETFKQASVRAFLLACNEMYFAASNWDNVYCAELYFDFCFYRIPVEQGKSLALNDQYSVSKHLILGELVFLPSLHPLFSLFFVILASVCILKEFL